MSTSSGSLFTTSPTATSSLLFGFATYGFLGGRDGLLCGFDLRALDDGSEGGGPHLGTDGRRAPETERATDTTEGVGEPARLGLLARDGSIDFLLVELLPLVFETVDDRLIVRCREANVELKRREDEAIGPETALLVDTTESRLEERLGMGSAL